MLMVTVIVTPRTHAQSGVKHPSVSLSVSVILACSRKIGRFSPLPSHQVQYYGLIKQSTGEDWENANISLSTAQPSIGGSAPSLPTRLIRFKRPPPPPGFLHKSIGLRSSFGGGGGRSFSRRAFAYSIEEDMEFAALPDADYDRLGACAAIMSSGIYDSPPSPPALDIAVTKVR